MVKFKFNKKFELEVVFKKLNSIRKIVDGDVSYEAFEFQELKSLLCSATDGPNNISPIAHDFCNSFALGRGSRNLTLSQDEFLGLCSAGLDDFHKKPQVQYLIITSLTSQGKFPFKCIAIDECEIHFGVSPRSKFMLTAVELRKPSEANIQSILPICNSIAHPYCTIRAE